MYSRHDRIATIQGWRTEAMKTQPSKRQKAWLDEYTLNQHDDYREAVARYHASQLLPTTRQVHRTAPDAHLTTLQRPGVWEQEEQWMSTHGKPIRQKVQFGLLPTNPQLDIAPTGKCEIAVRSVEVWVPHADQTLTADRPPRMPAHAQTTHPG
mmetsp:Transcript_19063/g.48449  ORF Transcript_19063/g.48449 Transcript_19063/m.48449 type:complete len:153 (-) Transcript_19063:61-519(-)